MCKGLATLPATCLKSAKDIKHKIGFFLQKSERQVADHKQTKDKDIDGTRDVHVTDVAKWKESFNCMMNSKGGRIVFTNFLRSEFSEENMDFWNACQEYKKTSLIERPAKAKLIYHQYVEVDSPNEVNLDSLTREETRQNLQSPSLSSFLEAEKKIYTLMEKDSYRRFVNSKLVYDLSHKPTADGHEKKGKKSGCTENTQVLTSGA